MFELTTPDNEVVVPHASRSATLLGARHTASGQEVQPQEAASIAGVAYPVPAPAAVPAPVTLDALRATFTALSPLQTEGYVICDAHFRRLKLKHPGYVALHHLGQDGERVHYSPPTTVHACTQLTPLNHVYRRLARSQQGRCQCVVWGTL